MGIVIGLCIANYFVAAEFNNIILLTCFGEKSVITHAEFYDLAITDSPRSRSRSPRLFDLEDEYAVPCGEAQEEGERKRGK